MIRVIEQIKHILDNRLPGVPYVIHTLNQVSDIPDIPGIYIFFDAESDDNDQLRLFVSYVGQSSAIRSRIKQHIYEQVLMVNVIAIAYINLRYTASDKLKICEQIVINSLKPMKNKSSGGEGP